MLWVSRLALALNLLSAVTALGAAGFWFRSAATELPPMRAYWGQAPPTDPLVQALQAGVRDNRIAALLAGVSALSMGAATLLQAVPRRQ